MRALVIAERRQRGLLSGRAAAAAAAEAGATISYTTWNEWETGKRPIGDSMRRAVMTLFGWPPDWPENPPTPARPGQREGTFDQVSLLRAELEQERAERRSEVQELRDQVEELIDQMAAIAEAVDVLRQQQGAGQSSPRSATE